jgi:hypothetical protein
LANVIAAVDKLVDIFTPYTFLDTFFSECNAALDKLRQSIQNIEDEVERGTDLDDFAKALSSDLAKLMNNIFEYVMHGLVFIFCSNLVQDLPQKLQRYAVSRTLLL